eukprot:TRINITY_DN22760_c0_g3_i1.p1 TRINITY_DN22760_c0_g3~~TRINITY_DN22760_c0_g3_i1.p1  ORF type:complete len:375 (+),score=52.74 TRINITY_DN22760_c0_g3_i1:86-1210(+)
MIRRSSAVFFTLWLASLINRHFAETASAHDRVCKQPGIVSQEGGCNQTGDIDLGQPIDLLQVDLDVDQEEEENDQAPGLQAPGCSGPLGLNLTKPKFPHAILITNIDLDGSRAEFSKDTSSIVENYAKKYSADVVKLQHRMPLACEHNLHVNFDVMFAARELLTRYERVLSMDDTIVLSPKAPSVFDLVPESKLGVVRETGITATDRDMAAGCRRYGVDVSRCLARRYELPINGGLMLLSQKHRVLIESITQPDVLKIMLPIGGLINQPMWNARIVEHNVSLHRFGPEWEIVGSTYMEAGRHKKRRACAIHMTRRIQQDYCQDRPFIMEYFVRLLGSFTGEDYCGGREALARHLLHAGEDGRELQCTRKSEETT